MFLWPERVETSEDSGVLSSSPHWGRVGEKKEETDPLALRQCVHHPVRKRSDSDRSCLTNRQLRYLTESSGFFKQLTAIDLILLIHIIYCCLSDTIVFFIASLSEPWFSAQRTFKANNNNKLSILLKKWKEINALVIILNLFFPLLKEVISSQAVYCMLMFSEVFGFHF